MKCPKCNSSNLQKKGKRLGRQRYKCKECNSSFTKGVPYRKAPTYEPLSMKCPKCGKEHIVRDGKLEDGAQRYFCKDCGLRFSDNSNYSLSITWECPYCGNLLSYSGYGKMGQREYKCKSCGKSCSGDMLTGEPIKRVPFRESNTSLSCPKCNSKNIRKAGFKNGKQTYFCNSCKKHFLAEYKVQPKEKGLKEQVIQLILSGQNLRKVCLKYGFSERYAREFMQPYYASEKVSIEQKDLIVRFGYHCKVPIDYLAPYIKCSERACKNILKEIREKN